MRKSYTSGGLVAAVSALAASALILSCRQDAPTSPPGAPPPRSSSTGPLAALAPDPTLPVLVGAGYIASCSGSGDESTASILDTVGGTVFTTGDNVTSSTATVTDYNNCYNGSWGRQRARTRPAVGDKDYATAGAGGYYTYFGGASVVGDSAKYFYSYDVGGWHVVVLNSQQSMKAGSAQDNWLKADLIAHPAACTAAIWDQPRFYTSGVSSTPLQAWNTLYAAGVDVIINGHQRNYERFAPQTPLGAADPAFGIRQFVVGTGGYSHSSFGSTPAANSEVRNNTAFGVLRLTLENGSYDWKFIPALPATFTDAGSGQCHGAPPPLAVPGGPYVGEGTIQFDGSASNDPGSHVPLSYRWDFGDGSAPLVTSSAKPTHAYANGAYTVTLVVTNSIGVPSAPATTSVNVSNIAPTVSAGAGAWVMPGDPFTLSGSFTDPGNDGPFTWSVDWGDGSFASTGSVASVGVVRPNHSYSAAGRFTVTLTVTDVQGASGNGRVDVLTNQPTAAAAIFIGAGDIAECGSKAASLSRAEKTAQLLDAEVAANPSAQVYTIGDNVYQDATVAESMFCYEPTWGRHNSRVHPSSGNHEYNTAGAAGYWQYFTRYAATHAFVGDSGLFYYSYDVGSWHIIVLNDNIDTKAGSVQEKWLEADLAAHPAKCTMAMWHKPKVYQGGSRSSYGSMWTPLYNAGAELVLNGHVHRYERYAEMTPTTAAAPGRGIREIIAGTGGAGIGSSTASSPNLEVSNGTTWGVLKLWLDTDGYYWKFIPIAGQTFTDMGYTPCH